ncbi:phosphoribosylaminoimidazolecarboxamide formyltransferase [Spirochaeta cellobiosiphila]|uniref:phosphoribosylaminoimidazolecarboxamide formyltransferase n=1 Tax=Spirochaeta cellobiosiphila TaxID=504483 RepID=UPI0004039DCC|nr:phosphoribosylaminoimidazolecarboxamide formyltransferase [Spirochaeta cellobiosiphila]
MQLKYGMNPNQSYGEVIDPNKALSLLNGTPSYINLLDALNSWQLVKEIRKAFDCPAAASFKHVTPSGVALAGELSEQEKKAYLVTKEVSPLGSAYLRARGSDRLASFGDFIALSHKVDKATATLIKAEVSDGIIAPEYDEEALAILKEKKKGKYVVFQMDYNYEPPKVESRDIYGITLKQDRNDMVITEKHLEEIPTKTNKLNDDIKRDLLLGMITLKYTQSNSLCAVNKGQVIGIGSGQQSRILCSGLALSKANVWYQKQNLDYSFLEKLGKVSRTEKDQLIEQEREKTFADKKLLKDLEGTCLISDGFFPQTDNIELAHSYGVQYIASPMGSIRDQDILDTCDKYGITFVNPKIRLFHH